MLYEVITIAKGILVPLRGTVEMIKEMEEGHLNQRLRLDRDDEIRNNFV